MFIKVGLVQIPDVHIMKYCFVAFWRKDTFQAIRKYPVPQTLTVGCLETQFFHEYDMVLSILSETYMDTDRKDIWHKIKQRKMKGKLI